MALAAPRGEETRNHSMQGGGGDIPTRRQSPGAFFCDEPMWRYGMPCGGSGGAFMLSLTVVSLCYLSGASSLASSLESEDLGCRIKSSSNTKKTATITTTTKGEMGNN